MRYFGEFTFPCQGQKRFLLRCRPPSGARAAAHRPPARRAGAPGRARPGRSRPGSPVRAQRRRSQPAASPRSGAPPAGTPGPYRITKPPVLGSRASDHPSSSQAVTGSKQGEQEGRHARDRVGQTSGAMPRCLNPGFSERIGNSTRTGNSTRKNPVTSSAVRS